MIRIMDIHRLAILSLPNVVFFPHTVIPMLISEPTYVRMVKDAIADESYVGISMAEPSEKAEGPLRYSPSRIATMGKPILLEEHEDGSLSVLIEGKQRIELLHVIQNIPYLVYKIKIQPDINSNDPFSLRSARISRLKDILDKWIEDSIEDSLERKSFKETIKGVHPIVNYLTMFMIEDPEVRQLILENTNLHERIQILNSLLRGGYPHCEDNLVAGAVKDFEHGERIYSLVH